MSIYVAQIFANAKISVFPSDGSFPTKKTWKTTRYGTSGRLARHPRGGENRQEGTQDTATYAMGHALTSGPSGKWYTNIAMESTNL